MKDSYLKILVTLGLVLLLPGLSLAAWNMDFQEGKTLLAHDIRDLHVIVMIISVIIFIGVFGFMFYSIFKHRKSVGHKAANFHENTTVEIIWTVIPFLILAGMAWPATETLLAMRDTSAPDMTIKATGYQWMWGYEYLDEGIQFYSVMTTPQTQINGTEEKTENYLLEVDNPVVVPVGKKVRVLTTANDVLHAWYVPALAVKQDAVPGFIRDTWFKAEETGIFRGQCAELCGKQHGFMPIVVHVVSQEEYEAWVSEQKAKLSSKAVSPDIKLLANAKADPQ